LGRAVAVDTQNGVMLTSRVVTALAGSVGTEPLLGQYFGLEG
jgi:hypothetical protein